MVGDDLAEPRLDLRFARRRGRLRNPRLKQRQGVGETGGRTSLALAGLELLQHLAGPRDDARRQARQARHLDPVGALGGARADLVQEDHLALPFAHRDGGGVKPVELLGQGRQFVVVGGEQAPAAVDVVQVLERRPGDREAVPGRGAPADLVEDHQRPRPGLVQDGGGLDHLDHEGRAAPGQVVGRPDPAEELVDDADPGRPGRHVAARLGEDGDQRVLAQEGRLAGHVGAGQQPDRGRAVGLRAQVAAVGDEALAPAAQRGLDHRVAPGGDLEGAAGLDHGPGPALFDRESRVGRRDIQRRQRLGGVGDLGLAGQHGGAELAEDALLDLQRPAAGVDDAAFQLGERHGGEAHRVGQGLAVDEALAQRRRQHPLGVARGDFDEIAEHVVVADLQRVDAGLGGVVGLHAGNHAAALVAQLARLVERGVMPGGDKAAVAGQDRRLRHQGGVEQGDDLVVTFHPGGGVGQ